jgi:hypothetical protein
MADNVAKKGKDLPSPKERAAAIVSILPPGFKWKIDSQIYGVAELAAGVNFDSEAIISELSNHPVSFPGKNYLGKRWICLLCGAGVLCTKAGDGAISCCGQPMAQEEPKPIPQSD